MSRRTGTLAEEVQRFAVRSIRDGECLMGPHERYGWIRYDGRSQMSAHRATYVVHNGPIPEGLVVRHTCDRIGCVEPTHLIVGTVAENNRDMSERGRNRTGLDAPLATVHPDVIRAAIQRYLVGGHSQSEIARELGVAQSTFGRWVRAEVRKDVGLPGFVHGKGSRIATGLQPCGTYAGYGRHHARGEEVCPECREAHRQYMRAYKAARRAA
ncbi:MAG: HNH endonuclease [Marmoricola sp.]